MNKFLIPLLTLASTCALAEDDTKPLALTAELGILNITGNTESSSIKGKFEIKQDFTHWRNSYLVEGLYKKDTNTDDNGTDTKTDDKRVEQLSAKKYLASAQTDYKLNSKHRGIFIYGGYEYDRFSGYDYQATVAVGYSDRLFKTDASFLDYSVGPGVAFAKAEDSFDETTSTIVKGESDHSAIIRISALYQYDISKGAKFTQILSSDIATNSDSNTKSKSETALTAQLSASFALKVSYTATHNSEVPDDIKSVDANTAVTLVYSF